MSHAYAMYFSGAPQFKPDEALSAFLHGLDHGYLANPEKNRADLAALMRALSAVADPNLSAEDIIARWQAERVDNSATGIIAVIAKCFEGFEKNWTSNLHRQREFAAMKAKYRAEAAVPPRRKRGRPSNAERAARAVAGASQ